MNTCAIHNVDMATGEQTFAVLQLSINKQTLKYLFITTMNCWWQRTFVSLQCWGWVYLSHCVSLTIQQLSLCCSGNSLGQLIPDSCCTSMTPWIDNEANIYDSTMFSLFSVVNNWVLWNGLIPYNMFSVWYETAQFSTLVLSHEQ